MSTADRSPWDRRRAQRALSVSLGLAVVLVLLGLNFVVSDPRLIPLTTTLLAPLVAAGAAGPRLVAGIGVASVCLGFVMGLNDDLAPGELWSRLALVAVASALSVGVAAARTRREWALDRASRVEALSTALQSGLIPTLAPGPQVEVVSVYQPGVHDLLLGGDFLDVITRSDGTTAFCLGDVSGHSPDAAALGAALRTTWRALALAEGEPVAWVEGLDRLLSYEVNGGELFATLLVGSVSADGTQLRVVTAGHHSPLLRTTYTAPLDLPDAPPLGLGLDLTGWSCLERSFTAPWGLLCYTDGLIEGRAYPRSAERYGVERLTARLQALPALLGEGDVKALIADVTKANGQSLEDDVAVLVLHVTPR